MMIEKDKALTWNKNYEKAFVQQKEHLSSPPILTKLENEETHCLYIVALNEVMGMVLIMERNNA